MVDVNFEDNGNVDRANVNQTEENPRIQDGTTYLI